MAKNVNQKATEEFLKLSGVSFIYFPIAAKKINTYEIRERFKPSFTNNYSFQQKINKLHTGVQWECKIIKTTGDLLDEDGEPLTEENDLWVHDPVDCV